jgi:hypothetical protein
MIVGPGRRPPGSKKDPEDPRPIISQGKGPEKGQTTISNPSNPKK